MKLHPNLPDHEYHALPEISASLLKRVHCDGPAEASAYLQGYRPISQDVADIGTWTHLAVLEPERFASEYARAFDPESVEIPDGAIEDSGAALKEACKARDLPVSGTKPALMERIREADPDAIFAAEAHERAAQQYGMDTRGRTWIPCSQYDQVVAMRDAVRAHDAGRRLLDAMTDAELTCRIEGDRRCRIDMVVGGTVIGDLKTTRDASAFAREVWSRAYDIQGAWYVDTARACGIDAEERFPFLVVDKRAPHTVGVYWLDEEALRYGRARYRAALDTWKRWCDSHEALRASEGHGNSVVNVPGWVRHSTVISDFD